MTFNIASAALSLQSCSDNEKLVTVHDKRNFLGSRRIEVRGVDSQKVNGVSKGKFALLNTSTSTLKVDAEFMRFVESHKIKKIVYKNAGGQTVHLSNYKFQTLSEKESAELNKAVNELMDTFAQLHTELEKEKTDKDKKSSKSSSPSIKPEQRNTREKPKANSFAKIFAAPPPSIQKDEDKISEQKALEKHWKIQKEEQETEEKKAQEKEKNLLFAIKQELIKQKLIKKS